MPELPEVEVLRRDLEKEIVGRRIKEVEVRPGSNAMKVIPRHGRRKEFQELLAGAKVDSVGRIGRRLLLSFDNAKAMVVDLGHTGQLLKTSTSAEMASHTHIVFDFTIGGQLRIADPERKAEIFVASEDEIEKMGELRTFIFDPLETPIAWPHFSQMLQEREEPVRDLLLDESFVCGLGNIYADEILFQAGIRHDRQSNKLSSQDVRRLYRALMETLQDAVRARGTSWGEASFVDLQGDPGQFQLELKVYEREGEACRRCRSMIVKAKTKTGPTYLCPQCQT